jgi:hypothetical protein
MLDISLPMLNKCLAKKLPHVLRFDFLKVRSIHFRKLHHLMFHTTVLRVSSASICRPPSVKSTSTRRHVPITHLRVDLTRGCVCFTHQRVAAADRRVSASSASSSCRRPPVEFKAPFIGAWCSRAVDKGPCRRCTIMLFVFSCFSGLFILIFFSVSPVSCVVPYPVFGSFGFYTPPQNPFIGGWVLSIRVKNH